MHKIMHKRRLCIEIIKNITKLLTFFTLDNIMRCNIF